MAICSSENRLFRIGPSSRPARRQPQVGPKPYLKTRAAADQDSGNRPMTPRVQIVSELCHNSNLQGRTHIAGTG
jgi:hypothetical protein